MTSEDIKTFEEKLVFNNFKNKDSIINNYTAESFEKERESYKAHITDLQKQVASLEKQVKNLYNLLQAR